MAVALSQTDAPFPHPADSALAAASAPRDCDPGGAAIARAPSPAVPRRRGCRGGGCPLDVGWSRRGNVGQRLNGQGRRFCRDGSHVHRRPDRRRRRCGESTSSPSRRSPAAWQSALHARRGFAFFEFNGDGWDGGRESVRERCVWPGWVDFEDWGPCICSTYSLLPTRYRCLAARPRQPRRSRAL